MPAGKSSESSAMLYTVITFVGLFLIATTCAVIFYVKAEDFKTQRDAADSTMLKLANNSEQNSLAKIVGRSLQGKSALGTMTVHLDDMVSAVTGQVADETPAAVKVNDAKIEINEIMGSLFESGLVSGTENVDLIELLGQLKSDVENARESGRRLATQLENLQDDFDATQEETLFKEELLIEEKNRFQTMADEIQAQYDDLQKEMELSTVEQVKLYKDRLKNEQEKLRVRGSELATSQAELSDSREQLNLALSKLEDIKPGVDTELIAFEPDARILRIDSLTKVVYLDIGSDDLVYPGLTFSIYDKSTPIPEDGKGKAEIEIFQVTQNVSAAKINSSSKKNAIVPEDIVANLIWNSKTSNRFVVSGVFDFDGDGFYKASDKDKICRIIQDCRGKIVDKVTVETDFLVVGIRPSAIARPTSEQIEIDPDIETKYEASLEKGIKYDTTLDRARALSVPIINQQRFLNLIGYHSLASKSSPF